MGSHSGFTESVQSSSCGEAHSTDPSGQDLANYTKVQLLCSLLSWGYLVVQFICGLSVDPIFSLKNTAFFKSLAPDTSYVLTFFFSLLKYVETNL